LNKQLKIGLVIGISAVLAASIIIIPSLLPTENQIASVDYVKITVLVDNNSNGTLLNPWGLSILVETDDLTILFDSGPDPSALENNSESLGIDWVAACDMVVVSHDHPDHVNGLPYVSDIRDNLTLYTPYYGFAKSWTSDLFQIEVEESAEVSPGISIIGMGFEDALVHSEEALVFNVENLGLVILVGCSHPGVENIVSTAIDVLNMDDVYMVLGGFHMTMENQETISGTIDALVDMGVENIYPIHCSGQETIDYLESNYPTNYGDAAVGFQITLNGTA
jgi:7,8-dihydropterin-6-yl-methyl-4-(beta-D-ribofuranosyl)aminobenzene 5'-phosphate synthase